MAQLVCMEEERSELEEERVKSVKRCVKSVKRLAKRKPWRASAKSDKWWKHRSNSTPSSFPSPLFSLGPGRTAPSLPRRNRTPRHKLRDPRGTLHGARGSGGTPSTWSRALGHRQLLQNRHGNRPQRRRFAVLRVRVVLGASKGIRRRAREACLGIVRGSPAPSGPRE